jgi:hypothetical protein
VVSLNAALALTRSILSTAGQFETLRTQLNAVEKSATKGGDAFATSSSRQSIPRSRSPT